MAKRTRSYSAFARASLKQKPPVRLDEYGPEVLLERCPKCEVGAGQYCIKLTAAPTVYLEAGKLVRGALVRSKIPHPERVEVARLRL